MIAIINIENYLKEQELSLILNKYIIHRNHSHEKRVISFALVIFDALKTNFVFSIEERNLLKYSAALHDIGYFIGSEMHHKHTKYIILHDEMFNNVPQELRLMLAIVSSGHRKSISSKIDSFDNKVKKNLLYLISILRVADVLASKSILRFYFKENNQKLKTLIIDLNNNCNQKLIKKIFKKAILFKELFSINIEIKMMSKSYTS